MNYKKPTLVTYPSVLCSQWKLSGSGWKLVPGKMCGRKILHRGEKIDVFTKLYISKNISVIKVFRYTLYNYLLILHNMMVGSSSIL